MCGIFCSICHEESDELQAITDTVLPLVRNRGPDSCQCHRIRVTNVSSGQPVIVILHGSVLHLRGDGMTRQPLVNKRGDALLWNGEVFGGISVTLHENDTEIMLRKLSNLPIGEEDEKIVELFSTVEGPWAFVFYESSRNKLWYGRDYFGRRSLVSSSCHNTVLLSSVSSRSFNQGCEEIAAKKLYCIDLKTLDLNKSLLQDIAASFDLKPKFRARKTTRKTLHRCTKDVHKTTKKNLTENISDSNVQNSIPSDIPTCCIGDGIENMSINGIRNSECSENNIDDNILTLNQIQERFLHVLEASVRSRVETIPRDLNCHKNCDDDDVTTLGILFSGGIDSVVLAALADRIVPKHESIDLINVAFEQKYKVPQNVKKKYIKPPTSEEGEKNYDVPDRITGRDAIKELNQDRQWNFIEVNVTLEELQKEREARISNLVSPLQTVLDDSIGCAIWFAARGVGKKYQWNHENKQLELVDEHYVSKVKVLLTGMGADEQLGGYARHRTKFENFGWSGLQEEMKMEVERISSRNLGRDDRCISDHGREARFPFLDERVVEFLDSLPVCLKCDPRQERGYGEKILLREISSKYLGLSSSSCLPKRAIQFGSRIAKLESSKEKGGQSCDRLTVR